MHEKLIFLLFFFANKYSQREDQNFFLWKSNHEHLIDTIRIKYIFNFMELFLFTCYSNISEATEVMMTDEQYCAKSSPALWIKTIKLRKNETTVKSLAPILEDILPEKDAAIKWPYSNSCEAYPLHWTADSGFVISWDFALCLPKPEKIITYISLD